MDNYLYTTLGAGHLGIRFKYTKGALLYWPGGSQRTHAQSCIVTRKAVRKHCAHARTFGPLRVLQLLTEATAITLRYVQTSRIRLPLKAWWNSVHHFRYNVLASEQLPSYKNPVRLLMSQYTSPSGVFRYYWSVWTAEMTVIWPGSVILVISVQRMAQGEAYI